MVTKWFTVCVTFYSDFSEHIKFDECGSRCWPVQFDACFLFILCYKSTESHIMWVSTQLLQVFVPQLGLYSVKPTIHVKLYHGSDLSLEC